MESTLKLNKEQKEAINTTKGNLLIVASAGTGKTTTIVERYVKLIKDKVCNPGEILMTTFTNKAAKDMTEKIAKRTDKLPDYIGTMHSLFLRILRDNSKIFFKNANFTLITDDSEKKKIIKEIIKKENIKASADDISYVVRRIGIFKSLGIFSESLVYNKDNNNEKKSREEKMLEDEIVYVSPEISDKIVLFYKKYQEFLKNSNLLDFDDILLYTLELFVKYPEIKEKYKSKFKVIMVDEAQDLSVVQIKIINHLANDNLCLIGDDSQNIYEWRGSSNELVFQFEKDHKKIILEENYRSTGNIISAVNKTIASMKFKIPKKLRCTKEKGDRIIIEGFEDVGEEIDYIVDNVKDIQKKVPLHDIAVLVRTNYLGKDIEREFIRNKIPCHLSKSKNFLEREEVKDIIAYLNLIVNPCSAVDFERLIKIFPGVGNVSIEKIKQYAWNNELNFIEVLSKTNGIKINDLVKNALLTVDEMLKTPGNPVDVFLEKMNYEELLSNKYSDENLKLEDKLENVNLVLDLFSEYYNVAGTASNIASNLVNTSSNSNIGNINIIKNFLDSLIELGKKEKDNNKVKISTIHSAKGLEWRHVFLACCNEKILPYYKDELTNIKRDSELRLFYVAISRAKDNLYITHSLKQKWQFLEASQFLDII
ncbi:ATP-dependent DNA helicase Rep [uncultured archaeon]|nr:ATP-dependent DNA helicase Rep [uncultured archaeon]